MKDSTSPETLSNMGEDPNLPGELKDQLLVLTVDRLSIGATLVTEPHFQKALEEGYQVLTGSVPSAAIKTSLGIFIADINEKNPEVLLLPGLESFITKSFMGMVRKMKWGVLELQEQGTNAIRNYIKQGEVKTLMDQLQVTPNQLNIRRCFNRVSNQVAGRKDPQQQQAAARLAQIRALARSRTFAGEQVPPSAYISDPVAAPDAEEIQQWERKEKEIQAQIRKNQISTIRCSTSIAYLKQGKISQEDASRLRKVHNVDEAVKKGKISQEKGSRIRNSILTDEMREQLDKKVREAVDYVVVYTQVFTGLKRIDPKYDEALRFLVRHKKIVNGDKIERSEMKPVISLLIEDLDCLYRLIELMGLEEPEVRMIAAGLLPYSDIRRQRQARIETLLIEENFVDDLRRLSEDDLVARLNAPDKRLQVRTAADIICMNVLIDRVIKATPFRKELRAVAQKVQGEVKEGEVKEGEAKEGELNQEEMEQGVLMGRVTRRVAGGQRLFLQRIMPDSEDPSRFVLVQRDPTSGEMVPIIRRGSKAYVEKNRDGLWKII